MRVLITGGSGFVGRHLRRTLQREGHQVHVMDLASPVPEEQGDIRDPQRLQTIFRGAKPEVVYHLAAIASVPQCQLDPVLTFSTNVIGTTYVARLAREHRAKLVFASSAAIYPSPRESPSDVSTPPAPENLYGLSKLACERIIAEIHPDASIARLFNVYGPDCQRSYVIPDAVRKLRVATKTAWFDGHGTEQRDFVYIDDAVRALVLCGESDVSGIFNVGSGRRTMIRSIVEEIRSIMARLDVEIAFSQPRPGDYRSNWAALGPGNTVHNWSPLTRLEQGLLATVDDLLRGVSGVSGG